jgi:hypothetical protein
MISFLNHQPIANTTHTTAISATTLFSATRVT